LYLDQKVNDGVSASITTTKVTLGPRNFTAAFFADASLYSGSTSALTLPLNTTVAGVIAGFSGTNTWSLLSGQQDWVTQGVTVSSAGILSVTQDALNYMSGKNVFVQVVGASGARAVGGARGLASSRGVRASSLRLFGNPKGRAWAKGDLSDKDIFEDADATGLEGPEDPAVDDQAQV
jgi:hypothetical protein